MQDLGAVVDYIEYLVDEFRCGCCRVVKYFLRLFADVFVTAAFGVRGAGVLIKSGRAGQNQAFDAFRVAFCENQGYVASQGVA